MLVYGNRLDLAREYKKWIEENGIADRPESVIGFLQLHGLLNEGEIKIFLYQSKKRDRNE